METLTLQSLQKQIQTERVVNASLFLAMGAGIVLLGIQAAVHRKDIGVLAQAERVLLDRVDVLEGNEA